MEANPVVWKSYEAITRRGDKATDRLLIAININYEKDKAEIEEIETEIERQKLVYQTARLYKFLNVYGMTSLEKHLNAKGAKSSSDLFQSIRWFHTLKFSDVPTSALSCGLLFILVAIILIHIFPNQKLYGAVSAAFAAVVPTIGAILSALQNFKNVILQRVYSSFGRWSCWR